MSMRFGLTTATFHVGARTLTRGIMATVCASINTAMLTRTMVAAMSAARIFYFSMMNWSWC